MSCSTSTKTIFGIPQSYVNAYQYLLCYHSLTFRDSFPLVQPALGKNGERVSVSPRGHGFTVRDSISTSPSHPGKSGFSLKFGGPHQINSTVNEVLRISNLIDFVRRTR